jgi:hypothetical protein
MRPWGFFLTTAEFAEFGLFDQEFFSLRPPRLGGEFSSGSMIDTIRNRWKIVVSSECGQLELNDEDH